MRFCCTFSAFGELGRAKKGLEPHADARERVYSPLLAVDDAQGRTALQAGLAKRLHSADRRASGRDDVLDEADALARIEDALDPLRSPVLLRLLPDDEERQTRGQRRGGREGNGSELGAGEPGSLRLPLTDRLRQPLAERPEEVGLSLEAVLVQV